MDPKSGMQMHGNIEGLNYVIFGLELCYCWTCFWWLVLCCSHPTFDFQGSLNKFHGQHALRERARKLDQGILIIRYWIYITWYLIYNYDWKNMTWHMKNYNVMVMFMDIAFWHGKWWSSVHFCWSYFYSNRHMARKISMS